MDNSRATAITVRNLEKSFESVKALADISFDVEKGEIFGFLGPNGAGKTTTINILTGLARPGAGMVAVGGIDCSKNPGAAQHLIGIVPDDSNLYSELTGFENLCFCGALYGMKKKEREEKARQLLGEFDLEKAAGRKFGGYSKGMKRKLTIAAGIIHTPQILFLDEPTTGIDVASSRQLRRLIAHLNNRGTTIFLTTHYIEEAERLCDRIAFIVEGRIVKVESVKKLLQPLQGKQVLLLSHRASSEGVRQSFASSFPDLSCTFPQEGVIRVEADGHIRVGPLVRFLEDNDLEVLEARRLQPSLEEIFMSVTGLEAKELKKEKQKGGKKK